MSKRIVYQCDRCAKQKEQTDQPNDWPSITAAYPPPLPGGYGFQKADELKIWCESCWAEIRRALPVAKAEVA